LKSLLCVFKILLNFIYLPFKLLKTKNNKVLFISRQSNNITLDFELLSKELRNKKYDVVILCKRFDNIKKCFISYIWFTLVMMFHISTCKVCVIDSYCLPISVLKHKKSLKVLQIWHSLTAIKQFGYQTLDKSFGRSSAVAYGLNMHKNYDLIVSGSDAMTLYFMKAFNYEKDKFINVGLPRLDYLLNEKDSIKEKIYKKYPYLNKKKTILYVPTFRKNFDCNKYVSELISQIDFKKYNLIIKSHPNQVLDFDKDKVFTCDSFSAMDLLTVSDHVITDYSGISVEAAILNKKTYYYLYDYDDYKKNNGLNIDMYEEMPGCVFSDSFDLYSFIDSNKYDMKVLKKYKDKFISNQKGNSTKLIVDVISSWCKEVKR